MTDSVQRFPTQIEHRATDEQLIKKLKKRVGDAIVDTGEPVFWRAIISNTNLDSHYTEMGISSLKNYARDAKSGVPFQDSHKTASIMQTLGRSLDAEYVSKDESGVAYVEADFYTFRGTDDITDAFLRKMERGLTNDVSVGFAPGRYMCSICNRDMMDWDWDNWEDSCFHYPGFRYKKEKGDKEKVLCTAKVEDARLVEVSTVYAGSTPGAIITKAERMIEAGKMPESMARKIEDRYQVRLLSGKRVYLPATTEERMGEQENPEPLGDGEIEERKEETVPATGVAVPLAAERNIDPQAQDVFEGVRDLLMPKGLVKGSLVDSVRHLIEENERLAPLADDGNAYRSDLMDQAIEEGIRAFGGDKFAEESYRNMFKTMPLDMVKRMKADWTAVADKIIPRGRTTTDTHEQTQVQQDKDPSRYRA